MIRCRPLTAAWFCIVAGALSFPGGASAQRDEDRYILPDAAVSELFEIDKDYATLDPPSPDGGHFLIPLSTGLSILERMAEQTYRLAMLEIRPRTDR